MGKHPNVKVGTKTRSCTKIETIINFSKFFSNIQTKKDIFFKIISTFALGCFPFTKLCIFLLTQNITNRFLLAIPQKKRLCEPV